MLSPTSSPEQKQQANNELMEFERNDANLLVWPQLINNANATVQFFGYKYAGDAGASADAAELHFLAIFTARLPRIPLYRPEADSDPAGAGLLWRDRPADVHRSVRE